MFAESSPTLDNKRILITGGTGTIGSQVVRECLQQGAFITVLSRDQNKQFTMNHQISSKRIVYKNGDICDRQILGRVMAGHDYVVHCAASKHVPLCEQNADSATKINVEGTRNVLQCAQERGLQKVLILSTDKAVYPTSVMGATKFLGERIALEYAKMLPVSIVRLGNVFASNGSVVPTFQDRLKNKLPLVVNDPTATRFFFTKKEAGLFITSCLKSMVGGEIFIKKMKWMTIQTLAECMSPPGYAIASACLTQGEKTHEHLFTEEESRRVIDCGDHVVIKDALQPEQFKLLSEEFSRDEIIQMLKEIK